MMMSVTMSVISDMIMTMSVTMMVTMSMVVVTVVVMRNMVVRATALPVSVRIVEWLVTLVTTSIGFVTTERSPSVFPFLGVSVTSNSISLAVCQKTSWDRGPSALNLTSFFITVTSPSFFSGFERFFVIISQIETLIRIRSISIIYIVISD